MNIENYTLTTHASDILTLLRYNHITTWFIFCFIEVWEFPTYSCGPNTIRNIRPNGFLWTRSVHYTVIYQTLLQGQPIQGIQVANHIGTDRVNYSIITKCTDTNWSHTHAWLLCDLNRAPIAMAKHGGSCIHFSGISPCERTSRETVSHPQRPPLPTLYKISLSVYVIVTNKRLQPLVKSWHNSLVLSFSLLKI